MSRRVKGLSWARILDGKPDCIPTSRPRGAKAKGLRYERELAKAMPAARHGTWFEFQDNNGHGFCQVDLMLSLERGVLLLEAKYTWTAEGHYQIEELYAPVVEKALNQPTRGIVVCKRLLPGMRGVEIANDLDSALSYAASGRRVVLHWLGGGLMMRAQPKSILAMSSFIG